jgi:hypothetical protein
MNQLKDNKGNTWNPYVLGYESEGMNFGIIFYAISKEHASLVLEDIKDTGQLVGEIKKRPIEDDSSAL